MQIFLTRLEIYEQRGGKSQRLLTGSANTKIYATHQKKGKKKEKHGFLFFSLAPSHLCVYLHRRGSISCQRAKWAAVRPTAPEPRVRIQSALRFPSGIQMSIPLAARRNLPPFPPSHPPTLSPSRLPPLPHSLSPPSALPRCLSGLVISCHPP